MTELDTAPDSPDLDRFTFIERIVHWLVGLTFVLLLMSGFALSYPALFWMTALFGGGALARMLHPWIGLVFFIGMVFMFALWLRDMFIDKADLAWLRAVKHYARHQRQFVPETGKYNGGQKVFYWAQSVLAVVFLITGIVLWFPDGLPVLGNATRSVTTTMRLMHYASGLGAGLLLIVHVYLGTIAYPGTARGMLHGKVSRGWAKLHHPLWHRQKTGT